MTPTMRERTAVKWFVGARERQLQGVRVPAVVTPPAGERAQAGTLRKPGGESGLASTPSIDWQLTARVLRDLFGAVYVVLLPALLLLAGALL